MRTDNHNNPVAFTTDIAAQAKLTYGVDYIIGDKFPIGNYYTAKLTGDPIAITIRVIDAIGFVTKTCQPRWIYINLPKFLWMNQSKEQKRDIIGYMYQHEGGLSMKALFPNYGKQ